MLLFSECHAYTDELELISYLLPLVICLTVLTPLSHVCDPYNQFCHGELGPTMMSLQFHILLYPSTAS